MSQSLKDGASVPLVGSSADSVKIDESLAAFVSQELTLQQVIQTETLHQQVEFEREAGVGILSESFTLRISRLHRTLVHEMSNSKRRLCVIFYDTEFDSGLQVQDESMDAENLKFIFEFLNFEVLLIDDMPCARILRFLQIIARQDHSNEDFFACCFLSHGEQGDLLYGRDGTVHIPDLLAPFKGDQCRSLAGKPKLFFIQACRGTKLDHGVFVREEDEVTDSARARDVRIPSEADFLVAYSAVPGHYSWRNAARGSWFVQALCEVFENFADKMDLLSMMTLVNAKVAYDFESQIDDPSMKHKKQIPCVVSMLTKQVWFVNKTLGQLTTNL